MSLWDKHNLELHEESLINIYIDDLEQGMNLIGKLLEENNQQTELSAEFECFNELIENNFLEIANKMAHPQNASSYHELILFKKRLEELIIFPEIYKKKVIAIGGGFSAGKSKLINLIIGEELLPTDTTPTTSIPTYIMNGSETLFYAHNIYGLKRELDEEAIKAITHAFSEKYKVSLAQIMKNILLKSSSMEYENIAILDTPGYSKSDHHKKELNKDEHMARVHLQSANALIWVVDIEKGTIPNQDFEFIKSMNVECPIFFVFNKADKKEQSDIETIIEVAKNNVINQGIQCSGIGAVSALLQKEYGNDRLEEFLHHENEHKSATDIKEEFLAIFNKYEHYIAQRIEELRAELKQLNEIALASSLKQEQDLLRPLIADKKKKISMEREKMKQLQIDLTPFLSSLEKIQELLNTETSENDIVQSKRNQFLQRLLKVNVKKIIQEKVTLFVEDISFEQAEKDELFSARQITNIFEQALSLLQKDILIKIEKEMFQYFEDMKKKMTKMNMTESEMVEIHNALSEILHEISNKFECYDLNMEEDKKLTDVLRKYDTFSTHFEELLKELLHYESVAIGNHMKETISSLYKDSLTYMLEQERGQE